MTEHVRKTRDKVLALVRAKPRSSSEILSTLSLRLPTGAAVIMSLRRDRAITFDRQMRKWRLP